jgi:hypothetical protein
VSRVAGAPTHYHATCVAGILWCSEKMHFLTLSATAQVNEKISASTTTSKTKFSNAKDVKNAKAVALCKSKSRFISTELATSHQIAKHFNTNAQQQN